MLTALITLLALAPEPSPTGPAATQGPAEAPTPALTATPAPTSAAPPPPRFRGVGLMTTAGIYCVGNEVTLADCMLVPQVYNARRFDMTLDDYPTIARIVANCEQLQAFIKAAPEQQPDAQP